MTTNDTSTIIESADGDKVIITRKNQYRGGKRKVEISLAPSRGKWKKHKPCEYPPEYFAKNMRKMRNITRIKKKVEEQERGVYLNQSQRKNYMKVVKEIINNPMATNAEIAQAVDLHQGTVGKIINSVNMKEIIAVAAENLIKKDVEVQEKAQEIILERMAAKNQDKVSTRDLVSVSEFAFKRSQLLAGGATENINENITVSFEGL